MQYKRTRRKNYENGISNKYTTKYKPIMGKTENHEPTGNTKSNPTHK